MRVLRSVAVCVLGTMLGASSCNGQAQPGDGTSSSAPATPPTTAAAPPAATQTATPTQTAQAPGPAAPPAGAAASPAATGGKWLTDGTAALPVGRIALTKQAQRTPPTVDDQDYISYRLYLESISGRTTNATDPGVWTRLVSGVHNVTDRIFVGVRFYSTQDKLLLPGAEPDESALPFITVLSAQRSGNTASQPVVGRHESVVLGPRPKGYAGDINLDVGLLWGTAYDSKLPELLLKAASSAVVAIGTGGTGIPALVGGAIVDLNSTQRKEANQFFNNALSTGNASPNSGTIKGTPFVIRHDDLAQGKRVSIKVYDRDVKDAAGKEPVLAFALEPEAPRSSLFTAAKTNGAVDFSTIKGKGSADKPIIPGEAKSSPKNLVRLAQSQGDTPDGVSTIVSLGAVGNPGGFNTGCETLFRHIQNLGFNDADTHLLAWWVLKDSYYVKNIRNMNLTAVVNATTGQVHCPTAEMNTAFKRFGLEEIDPPGLAAAKILNEGKVEADRKAAEVLRRSRGEFIIGTFTDLWVRAQLDQGWLAKPSILVKNEGDSDHPVKDGFYSAQELSDALKRIKDRKDRRLGDWGVSKSNPRYWCGTTVGKRTGDEPPVRVPIAIEFESAAPGVRIDKIHFDPVPTACQATARWEDIMDGLMQANARFHAPIQATIAKNN